MKHDKTFYTDIFTDICGKSKMPPDDLDDTIDYLMETYLNDAEREILIYKYENHMKNIEIAQIVNLQPGSLYNKLNRILCKLAIQREYKGDYLSRIILLGIGKYREEEERQAKAEFDRLHNKDILKRPMKTLGELPNRLKLFEDHDIGYFLQNNSEESLLRRSNIGQLSIDRLKELLRNVGLKLERFDSKPIPTMSTSIDEAFSEDKRAIAGIKRAYGIYIGYRTMYVEDLVKYITENEDGLLNAWKVGPGTVQYIKDKLSEWGLLPK